MRGTQRNKTNAARDTSLSTCHHPTVARTSKTQSQKQNKYATEKKGTKVTRRATNVRSREHAGQQARPLRLYRLLSVIFRFILPPSPSIGPASTFLRIPLPLITLVALASALSTPQSLQVIDRPTTPTFNLVTFSFSESSI